MSKKLEAIARAAMLIVLAIAAVASIGAGSLFGLVISGGLFGFLFASTVDWFSDNYNN